MNADWQAGVAIGIVIITALLFVRRSLRKKKAGGCANCGSSTPPVGRK